MLVLQWPQIVFLCWCTVSLSHAAALHKRETKASFPYTLIRVVLLCLLLGWGGFFNAIAHAQTVPAQAQRYRLELTRTAHSQWGLDAPIAALAAQIHQESGWNPQAMSQVGAEGMAQFMPATARWWCDLHSQNTDCNPYNPTWALRALVGYDKYLFDRTPPRLSDFDRLWVALRAYNGGLGHWKAEAASTELAWPTRSQVDAACGKARRHISHCPENLHYPHRILVMLQPRYSTWGVRW